MVNTTEDNIGVNNHLDSLEKRLVKEYLHLIKHKENN